MEATVKLQSSKSRNYSDSEDEDDDDDDENSENIGGRRSNTPKRKRSRGPPKSQAKKQKTADDISAETVIENQLGDITNSDNIPNKNTNNTDNVEQVEPEAKLSTKPKKRRRNKLSLSSKTKKGNILNLMQTTKEQNKENAGHQSSGFFEAEADSFGQNIRPCEIVEVLKEECELDPSVPTKSVHCFVCNSAPKLGKLPPSIQVQKTGKIMPTEKVLAYTKVRSAYFI